MLPVDGAAQELQVQQFRPMPSQASNYFHAVRADTPLARTWELGLVLNYANDPLVIHTQARDSAEQRTGELIKHMLVLDLLGAVSLTDWLEVGIALPIYLYDMGETGQGFARFELDDPASQGIGDIRLVPKIRLARWEARTRTIWRSASPLTSCCRPRPTPTSIRAKRSAWSRASRSMWRSVRALSGRSTRARCCAQARSTWRTSRPASRSPSARRR